jgi:hypothetical protein
VELSNIGVLVTLVTWDRKNQTNIVKQFEVFTQYFLSDEKFHDLLILLPENNYIFSLQGNLSKPQIPSVFIAMNRKTTVHVGNAILAVKPVVNRLND